MRNILVVDDERNIRVVIQKFLKQEGYEVDTARNYEEAITLLNEIRYELVLTDMKLPGKSGIELLKVIKRETPDIPVIMITAYGSIENAVEAIKEGAYNYLTKPLELDDMLVIIKHTLLHKGSLTDTEQYFKERYGIVGDSKVIIELLATINMISNSRANVLITGESGTGKELVAKAVHLASPRRESNFVAINCAAIPQDLIENELFGHEEGAYTGAVSRRGGKIELADHGTLFLDEIGEMSQSMQIKLLRFIQEKEFYRIGGFKAIKSDCRIIAATNKNLEEEIDRGTFREDLFYRLNVIPVVIPPLRERKEDIPLLVDNFLKKYSEENNKFISGIEHNALDALMLYNWPGNIRELENIIERAIVLSRFETIMLADLPKKITNKVFVEREEKDLGELAGLTLPDLERLAIINALKEENWNQTKASERLGITRRQLRTKMIKYKLL